LLYDKSSPQSSCRAFWASMLSPTRTTCKHQISSFNFKMITCEMLHILLACNLPLLSDGMLLEGLYLWRADTRVDMGWCGNLDLARDSFLPIHGGSEWGTVTAVESGMWRFTGLVCWSAMQWLLIGSTQGLLAVCTFYWQYSKFIGSIQSLLAVFTFYWQYSHFIGSIQGLLAVFKVYSQYSQFIYDIGSNWSNLHMNYQELSEVLLGVHGN
jgi:hypothetical protein